MLLPFTIFLLIIVLLDINLASGLLNTFVFFSQMLPSLDLYAGGEIPIPDAAKPFVEFYQFCYGLFNLEYFESLDSMPGWCTFKYRSALTGALFGYFRAIWPLVFISFMWFIIFASEYCICIRKLRRLYQRIRPGGFSLGESFFRGLVTFIMLSYTKFTLVTLTILTPAYLTGPGGKKYRLVANLDGTLEYFGNEHFVNYAIPAIFVLVFIILLPLVIFATYPYMCNWLGIRTPRLMYFFDTLCGTFKNKRRFYYFALLYFVYRIALVAIFTFTPEVHERYILQHIFISIVLMLHMIAQPYKERYHNILDVCLLALIPAVISISFFQLFRVTNSASVNQSAMAIQIILLYIPLVYLAAVFVYKLYQWRKRNGYEQINNPPAANGNIAFFELTDDQFQGDEEANNDNNL